MYYIAQTEQDTIKDIQKLIDYLEHLCSQYESALKRYKKDKMSMGDFMKYIKDWKSAYKKSDATFRFLETVMTDEQAQEVEFLNPYKYFGHPCYYT